MTNPILECMIERIAQTQIVSEPIDHLHIEEFLPDKEARALAGEFAAWQDASWHSYDNAIEHKKTCNTWNSFEAATYRYFLAVNSQAMCRALEEKFGMELVSDPGLHGGGQHFHSKAGILNPHLDYSLHPKLGMERRINVIYYLSDNHVEKDGGHFGLWGNQSSERPGDLVKEYPPSFNSAVIFDTSQNSWHGISREYNPDGARFRKSLASYYMSQPRKGAPTRSRARFSARADQEETGELKELIAMRADEGNRHLAYVSSKSKPAPKKDGRD